MFVVVVHVELVSVCLVHPPNMMSEGMGFDPSVFWLF